MDCYYFCSAFPVFSSSEIISAIFSSSISFSLSSFNSGFSSDSSPLAKVVKLKSGDELKKIEAAAGDAPIPEKALPPEADIESEADQRIRERVQMFREQEGRDPDTGKKLGSLLGEQEFDDFATTFDPARHHFNGDTNASPLEEKQMAQVYQSVE